MEDQKDILAANERLTAENAAGAAELSAERATVVRLTGEVSASNADRDKAIARAVELDASVADLTQRLAAVTGERDGLAAVDRDFGRRLAAELAKHGVRAQGVAVGGDDPASKLSLTEQCRLARGT